MTINKSKKGLVVNRKRNRTIAQDVALRDRRRWQDMGGGILRLACPDEAQTAYITLKGGRFVNLRRKSVAAVTPKVEAAAE